MENKNLILYSCEQLIRQLFAQSGLTPGEIYYMLTLLTADMKEAFFLAAVAEQNALQKLQQQDLENNKEEVGQE